MGKIRKLHITLHLIFIQQTEGNCFAIYRHICQMKIESEVVFWSNLFI